MDKYKHIDTTTTIRAADPHEDYLYDDSFRDRAFVIEWKFTRQGCDSAGCFPFYTPARTCSRDDAPRVVHPAITACAPACFAVPNTMNPFYSRWAGTKCITVDAGTVAFFIDPALRADATGRDKYTMTVEFPDDTREFIVNVDEDYCRQFGMAYDAAHGECTTTNTAAGAVVSFFTGDSLVKMFRLGADGISEFFVSLLSRARNDPGHTTDRTGYEITESAERARERWIAVQNTDDTGRRDPIAVPVSLNKLGIGTGGYWTDGRVHFVRARRSVYDTKVRPLVDQISYDLINHPMNVAGGFAIDHAVGQAKKYVVRLKRKLMINTRVMSELEKRAASSAIRQMTIDRVAVEMGRMITLSARLSTAALSVVGLVTIIGPALDLFFATCWDPMNMNFRPISNADARAIIQTAAVNMWRTEPLEFLPEYAWDNYYCEYNNNDRYDDGGGGGGGGTLGFDEVMYAAITAAVIEYTNSRKTSASGSNLASSEIKMYDQQILEYDTMPSLCARLMELYDDTKVLCIMGTCIVAGFDRIFILYLVVVVITVILTFRIYGTVNDYNKNSTVDFMDNVEYVI